MGVELLNGIEEIYSSVWKGMKENQECTNGDYSKFSLAYDFMFLSGQSHMVFISVFSSQWHFGHGLHWSQQTDQTDKVGIQILDFQITEPWTGNGALNVPVAKI